VSTPTIGLSSAPATEGAGPDPRVAIVVASRDRRDVLLETLPRHLAMPERPHVVLVDDASTDGTADAVAAALPHITVIRLERSCGGAARNAGLQAAGTPYVALCDDDSWWTPGALRRAADLLDRHPRLALINGLVLVGPDLRVDPVCVEMARSPLELLDGQPGRPLLSFLACAAVVRRSAVLQAGGFLEHLRVGGEEELLGWDLAAAGWWLSYVPEIVARHDPPPNDGRPGRREIGLRNHLWTTWLRRPLGPAVARTVGELSRAPADRHTLRGALRALAGLPWIVRQRRPSPPHVERMRQLLDAQGPPRRQILPSSSLAAALAVTAAARRPARRQRRPPPPRAS
jgi:N-acetylglucosaminyl-diphospho-decaprenol L-rhamnosyltransferase